MCKNNKKREEVNKFARIKKFLKTGNKNGGAIKAIQEFDPAQKQTNKTRDIQQDTDSAIAQQRDRIPF